MAKLLNSRSFCQTGVILILLSLFWTSAQGVDLMIEATDLGISRMIPKEGQAVTFLVPVHNRGPRVFEGAIELEWAWARKGEKLAPGKPVVLRVKLEPGAWTDVPVHWKANCNGWHHFRFNLKGAEKEPADFELPVVNRDLYFAWFGAPLEFRWCNVPCAVRDGDEGPWLRRGAIPCHWKGAECYKTWPEEKFFENWSSAPRIAIDEMGSMSEHTRKFIRVLQKLRTSRPEQFIAVWFMGAGHEYWADLKGTVDLFMPERYLNYYGYHLGAFDGSIRIARETGTMPKMIPGLGVNIRKNKKTGETIPGPSKEEVLREVRYLKRMAPELPGLAFFTTQTEPGVGPYADQLCKEYFIDPVLTFTGERPTLVRAGNRLKLEAQVSNTGGMDAEQVKVLASLDDVEGTRKEISTIRIIRAGERRHISGRILLPAGIHRVTLEIEPSEDYTLLDGTISDEAMASPGRAAALKDARGLVYLPLVNLTRRDIPLAFPLGNEAGRVRVVEVDRVGQILRKLPGGTSRQGAGTGMLRWVAPGETRPGQARFFAFLPEKTQREPDWNDFELRGKLFRIRNRFYAAELDTSRDLLPQLLPAGTPLNLFKRPWELSCPGHSGFLPASIDPAPGLVSVTVPFESAELRGFSQYLFYKESPCIEIFRRVVPKGSWRMKYASDRCGLEQLGGVFVLQRGVGGIVQRGQLQDGRKYRDLLFGYGGGPPGPDNAGKAGWFDLSFAPEHAAGLGVAIARRWRDSKSSVYDVTRLYDADDRLEVMYVWGKEHTITRAQETHLCLVPHPYLNLADPLVVPPARQVWATFHHPLRKVSR